MGFREEREGVLEAEDFVDQGGADGAEEGAGQVAHHVVGGGHLCLWGVWVLVWVLLVGVLGDGDPLLR